MARPHKFFKNLRQAKVAARKRKHFLWRYAHKGYLGKGFFVGEKLPQKILVTSATVTKIKFSRRMIAKTEKGISGHTIILLDEEPEKPW